MNKNYKAQYTEVLTEKQAAKLAAWQRWGNKMQMLREIHKELGRVDEVVIIENEDN